MITPSRPIRCLASALILATCAICSDAPPPIRVDDSAPVPVQLPIHIPAHHGDVTISGIEDGCPCIAMAGPPLTLPGGGSGTVALVLDPAGRRGPQRTPVVFQSTPTTTPPPSILVEWEVTPLVSLTILPDLRLSRPMFVHRAEPDRVQTHRMEVRFADPAAKITSILVPEPWQSSAAGTAGGEILELSVAFPGTVDGFQERTLVLTTTQAGRERLEIMLQSYIHAD